MHLADRVRLPAVELTVERGLGAGGEHVDRPTEVGLSTEHDEAAVPVDLDQTVAVVARVRDEQRCHFSLTGGAMHPDLRDRARYRFLAGARRRGEPTPRPTLSAPRRRTSGRPSLRA